MPQTTEPTPIVLALTLHKGREAFVLRYEAGSESVALDELVAWVNRADLTFDWFDAAVLSHQLGQHLAKELKERLPKANH